MRLLTFISGIFFAVCCYAQLSNAELAELYSKDVKESVENMKNGAEVWNQGAEPFSQFIEKFSTDEEFCNSRIKLTAAQRAEYKSVLAPSNFVAKLPYEPNPGDGLYYQQWGEMQRNTVYLDCGWVESYYTHTFEFKRIGGKWVLAKIVPGE